MQQQNVTAKFRESSEAPSILLIRLSSLGDIVLSTPLIVALRERYPASTIELVIAKEYESLLPALPGLSRIHTFDKRTGLRGLRMLRKMLLHSKYDFVLDLHNVPRTKLLRQGLGKNVGVIQKRTFKRWLLVRWKTDRMKKEPDVIGRYFETASALGITDSGTGPMLSNHALREAHRIAIAPGSRHWNKRWPAEHFASVAKQIVAQGYYVDIHGSNADRAVAASIAEALPEGAFQNFTGQLDLAEVTNELAKAIAIITNDSGLMHIAEAVGTKVIGIFGPTVKQFGFAPRAADAIVLEIEQLYCRPCTAIGLDRCPEKHFRCMREITPENVMVGLEIIASNRSPKTSA